jgi:hypothetical protein
MNTRMSQYTWQARCSTESCSITNVNNTIYMTDPTTQLEPGLRCSLNSVRHEVCNLIVTALSVITDDHRTSSLRSFKILVALNTLRPDIGMYDGELKAETSNDLLRHSTAVKPTRWLPIASLCPDEHDNHMSARGANNAITREV